MAKPIHSNVARSTGPITPAIAAARKAAKAAAAAVLAADLKRLEDDIGVALMAGDMMYAAALKSIYNTLSKH